MIVGVGAGSYLFYKDAPYGRFTKTDWGPMISNKLGWFFMELTVMVAFAARLIHPRGGLDRLPAGALAWDRRPAFASTGPPAGASHGWLSAVSHGWLSPAEGWFSPAGFMIGLFFIHYIHRSLVYPWMIRTSGKKMPVVIMLSAVLFNLVNGSLLGIWFARYGRYPVVY